MLQKCKLVLVKYCISLWPKKRKKQQKPRDCCPMYFLKPCKCSWNKLIFSFVHQILAFVMVCWCTSDHDICILLLYVTHSHYICFFFVLPFLWFWQNAEISSAAKWPNWSCKPWKKISSGDLNFYYIHSTNIFVHWYLKLISILILCLISKMLPMNSMPCLHNGRNFVRKTLKFIPLVLILKIR